MAGRGFPFLRGLDLQVRIIGILIAVIIPVSIAVTFFQSRLLDPVLKEEVRQSGFAFAEGLANRIEGARILNRPQVAQNLETRIQKAIYRHPSVIRVDVFGVMEPGTPIVHLASSVENGELEPVKIQNLYAKTFEQIVEEKDEDEDSAYWVIWYPMQTGDVKANLRVWVSLRLVNRIQDAIIRYNFAAALISMVLLIGMLTYFLRKAILSEKQLQVAQDRNEILSGKLQEIQQELIHNERLAVMGQLTAGFAHEIGTPLNAIGGHLHLLQTEVGSSVSSERFQIIKSQISKIEGIVKSFLGRVKMPIASDRQVESLRSIVRRTSALLAPTLERYQIRYEEDLGNAADSIEVVSIEIEQILLNLMNNAIDSMKAGSSNRVLRITSHSDLNRRQVELRISDSGVGIPADLYQQIFRPFFTTKESGEGHGLGLSICRDLVQSYEGNLTVLSEVGVGSIFTLTLPLSQGESQGENA